MKCVWVIERKSKGGGWKVDEAYTSREDARADLKSCKFPVFEGDNEEYRMVKYVEAK